MSVMVEKEDALNILKQEVEYEEKISKDLSIYSQESLAFIPGLSEEELEELNDKIDELITDTTKHHQLLTELIDYILKNGKNKF